MNAFTSILSKMPGLKSSADFADALGDLETEHAAATAAAADLESQREDLIFSGGNLTRLDADIAAAEGQVRTLTTAIEGARKRRDQAAEAESQAELEAVAKAAGKLNKTLRAELISFGKVAETLTTHAAAITELRAEILEKNNHLRACGRSDLVARDPIRDLPEALDRLVGDPLRNLHIEEFWPRHGKGPALLELRK